MALNDLKWPWNTNVTQVAELFLLIIFIRHFQLTPNGVKYLINGVKYLQTD